ncbi:MAG: hypothetical protein M5U34_41160 [Chloroflexi bacterium]|nr:hypothetical protein [Chloroflexota bacterium]
MKAFNKIGFHTASGGNPTGIGDYLKKLDAANVPFVIKAADAMTGLFEAQELVRQRPGVVPHVLVFGALCRLAAAYPSGNPDVPDCEKEPEAAAADHWQWHKAHFPSDLDPKLTWVGKYQRTAQRGGGSGLDWQLCLLHRADGLGRWLPLFGLWFSSGTPDEGAWETDGMLRYLESCQQKPGSVVSGAA